MADTATRFYLGQPGTTAGNLYGAVAAATTAIVRNIHITNTTNTDAWVSISVGTTAIDTAASRIFDVLNVPGISSISHGTVDWGGFIVVNTGEFITGKQGTASALTVEISGVLVT